MTPKGPFISPAPHRAPTPEELQAARDFHLAYYDGWSERRTLDLSWFGYRAIKCPMDLWIYQEIIYETEPEVIVETGTHGGGSALFLAHMCDLANRGRVISVDIVDWPDLPVHPRIQYVVGSSVLPELVAHVAEACQGKRTMIILDSDHKKPHVLEELKAYSALVTPGCYLIVEDTNVNGHPAFPQHGEGPMEALDEFLAGNSDFAIDQARERFLLTMNPRGYLRRL